MCQDDIKNRHGASLEDGKAHEKDHQSWSRRSFLKNMGLAGSAGMVLGGVGLNAVLANPLAYAFSGSGNGRILVLVKLNGGNDGLNTVIPSFDFSRYSQLRQNIAISPQESFAISPEISLPNAMSGIQNMWNDGKMKIVHNVGYEQQNLSHFRSTDIWQTGSDSVEYLSSGWIGRFLENEYPDFLTNPPDCPPAIEIGGSDSYLFDNREDIQMSVNFANASRLQDIAELGAFYDVANVPDCFHGNQLAYSRSIANTIYRYAEVISDAYDSNQNVVSYPNNLGDQLAIVARLIKGELGTQFYTVTLNGFDTHAGQKNTHLGLLQNLADSVAAFYNDLEDGGFDKQVLVMTYSEFGRRVQQNASQGTDHGAAAPSMFFGPGLNGNALIGNNPDLSNLDANGNLRFDIDYRRLYASVLENWLCINPQLVDNVLGRTFDRLDELELNCLGVSNQDIEKFSFKYKFYQNESNEFVVNYSLPSSSRINVEIFSVMGQKVADIFHGQKGSGDHAHTWQPRFGASGFGYYVCKLTVGGKVFSKPVILKRG